MVTTTNGDKDVTNFKAVAVNLVSVVDGWDGKRPDRAQLLVADTEIHRIQCAFSQLQRAWFFDTGSER